MLIRDFTCANCGASRQTLDDALVVICSYCDALIATDTQEIFRKERVVEHARRAVDRIVNPTAADARKLRLGLLMSQASSKEEWRPYAEEYFTLAVITEPEQIEVLAKSSRSMREQVARWMTFSELTIFDPEIKKIGARLGDLGGSLPYVEDPVAQVRQMHVAACEYYRALIARPELPTDALPEGVEHHARNIVRSYVAAQASTLGEGVAARIYELVFGDRRLDDAQVLRCRRCGAELEPTQRTSACPFCDAVVAVERDDPWLSSTLAGWEVTKQTLVRDGRLDGTYPVLAALAAMVGSVASGRGTVSPELGVTFMRRAVPWVTAEALQDGFALYVDHAFGPKEQALMRAVRDRLGPWRADPRARPSAEPPVPAVRSDDRSPAEWDSDPWVEQTLTVWELAGVAERVHGGSDPLEAALLSMALGPFYLGASRSAKPRRSSGARRPTTIAASCCDGSSSTGQARRTP